MKKLSLLCAGVLMTSIMAGCGQSGASTETAPAETSAAVAAAETTELKKAEANFSLSSVDYAKQLKLGWNLGNTLDALGNSGLETETAWGQPKTTKEMIKYVKDAGFTSIRVPVSWGQHTDKDFHIDKAWMGRVTEVVDYAYDAGLYVIINSHHDNDKKYYYPDDKNYENSEKYIETIWSQVADNFKDYDQHLIFESMNEPRLSGTSKEWWFQPNDAEGVASIKNISKLNQVFVDTVRKSGGNNDKRYLMVPSNAASPSNALNDAFTMPTDSDEHIILSVHAYTPYDFAMNYGGGYKDWSETKGKDLSFMDDLNKKFILNGYGVVIGEFGATNKNNLDARVAWAKQYTEKAASYGIPCFLWDNGGTDSGDENFGMINRSARSVYFPEILDTMKASYE